MSFPLRAVVAILAGVGAGIIGFGIAWALDERFLFLDSGSGRDTLFLGSIFAPGLAVALLVFRSISRALGRRREPVPPFFGATVQKPLVG